MIVILTGAPNAGASGTKARFHVLQGRSSAGRAAVSKTAGRGFDSLRPCQRFTETSQIAPLELPLSEGLKATVTATREASLCTKPTRIVEMRRWAVRR